jgi:hypothetical protein
MRTEYNKYRYILVYRTEIEVKRIETKTSTRAAVQRFQWLKKTNAITYGPLGAISHFF